MARVCFKDDGEVGESGDQGPVGEQERFLSYHLV